MYLLFENGRRAEFLAFLKDITKLTTSILNLMIQKQESKHIIYLDANNLQGYEMSKFLSTSGFKCLDPKEFDLN